MLLPRWRYPPCRNIDEKTVMYELEFPDEKDSGTNPHCCMNRFSSFVDSNIRDNSYPNKRQFTRMSTTVTTGKFRVGFSSRRGINRESSRAGSGSAVMGRMCGTDATLHYKRKTPSNVSLFGSRQVLYYREPQEIVRNFNNGSPENYVLVTSYGGRGRNTYDRSPRQVG